MQRMTGFATAPLASGGPLLTLIAGSRPVGHENERIGAASRDLTRTSDADQMRLHSPEGEEPFRDVGHDREQQTWIDTTPGERMKVRLHSRDVDGKFCMLESVADIGTATSMHVHAEDEVSRVLEGEVMFSVQGKLSVLREGSQILIRSGTPHAWRNRSSAPVRLLTIFSPGGIEALFLRLPGLPPDEVVRLAADYGTLLIGPPLPE